MNKYALCDRKGLDAASARGLSCDESGAFIAGDVPLIIRSGASERVSYKVRPIQEIEALLSVACARSRGYSGFGKDYNSCVLGQVSEECGGNPTA